MKFPKELKISILQEDIDKAIEEYDEDKNSICEDCVVAQAVKRILKRKRVLVGMSCIMFFGKKELQYNYNFTGTFLKDFILSSHLEWKKLKPTEEVTLTLQTKVL